MSWPPGTKLGPYEIIAPLGAGGMGEIHRARDTRLNREVAIKAIPASLAGDEQLRQRFEREAKAISSLNHPHICTLYDVGHTTSQAGSEGRAQLDYLVMELLDGESLADRLVKGPLPIHEVLKIGAQIASALDAAHRQGIIHRDLKPGNIMLTKAGAKLLDFGLARTAAGGAPPVSGIASGSSQMATAMQSERPLTAKGTILGTFQYMAPEQLEGTDADARTDIFSLGAVLYEMATGKRAFQGGSMTSLIAAIVSSQPVPIKMMVPVAPAALDHVVRRCLEKDPADRWQSARDVGAELQWIAEAGSQAEAAAPMPMRRKTREALAWGLAGVLAVAALGLGLGYVMRPAPTPPQAFRATIMPPPGNAVFPFDLLGLALSPDGKTLAFVASTADGRKQIWLRNLTEMESRPMAETNGASYPFWSPDGGSLGFFAEGKLKTIDLRGGSPRVIADAPTGRGGTWGSDGTILFAPNVTSSILRVSSNGGEAKPVTTYDPKTEATQRWPLFLPDGKHFLYVSRARVEGRAEFGRLMLASLGDSQASVLIGDSTNALYVAPGYLIYGRSANLYAWRFDAQTLRLQGEAVPIVSDKLSYWEPKNFVPFAAAGDGTLIFLPESWRSSVMRWCDRQGRALESLGPPGYYQTPRISPDGRKVAYMQAESAHSQSTIWVRDLESEHSVRLTQQAGAYAVPAWSPDGSQLAFQCQPKGMQDLCIAPAAGGGEPRVLYESGTWKTTGSWMPDGKRLLFSNQDPKTEEDILILPVGGGEPAEVLRTPFNEDYPQGSPDGARVAFVSDMSGRFEVYVRNLGGGKEQWQISTDGGANARWRTDSKELFYESGDGYLMAVPWQQEKPGTPVRLFQISNRAEAGTSVFEDVTPDGQRFLLNVPTTSLTSLGFYAITHWPSLPGTTAK